MAAVNAYPGIKICVVDDSLATANATAGVWSLDQCVFYGGFQSDGHVPQLNFPTGATITFSWLDLEPTITFNNNSTSPVFTAPNSSQAVVYLHDGATIMSSTSAAFFHVPNGVSDILSIVMLGGQLGDGVHPVVQNDEIGTPIFTDGAAFIDENALTGSQQCLLELSADTFLSQLQFTVPIVDFNATSALVGYTPAVSANWNPAPAIVGGILPFTLNTGALDQIVLPNFAQKISTSPISGSGISTFALGSNLTRLRAGLFRVTAWLSGTDTAAESIGIVLVRDGSTVIGPVMNLASASAGASNRFGATFTWTDHITDTAAHTWSVQATPLGGTITVPSGNAGIEVVEQ